MSDTAGMVVYLTHTDKLRAVGISVRGRAVDVRHTSFQFNRTLWL